MTDWEDSCIRHMKSEHPGWIKELSGIRSSFLAFKNGSCNL